MSKEYFIQACLDCPEWDSVTCDVPLGVTVHRYPDNEFWILPNDPKPTEAIGRIVNTPDDLRRYFEGRPYVGHPLRATMIS